MMLFSVIKYFINGNHNKNVLISVHRRSLEAINYNSLSHPFYDYYSAMELMCFLSRLSEYLLLPQPYQEFSQPNKNQELVMKCGFLDSVRCSPKIPMASKEDSCSGPYLCIFICMYSADGK